MSEHRRERLGELVIIGLFSLLGFFVLDWSSACVAAALIFLAVICAPR